MIASPAAEWVTCPCPWHGWEYDLKTGQCLSNTRAAVQTYPVKTENEEILIAV
jgi:nitrite reductase/ring-hydroxylating ferredoxin subunit